MTTTKLTLIASRGDGLREKSEGAPQCSRCACGLIHAGEEVRARACVDILSEGRFRHSLTAEPCDLMPLLLACHILTGEILERLSGLA